MEENTLLYIYIAFSAFYFFNAIEKTCVIKYYKTKTWKIILRFYGQ